jgi:hypothetical protein
MADKDFDDQLQMLFTEIVEVGFEYIGRNKIEVDVIFIYASLEEEDLFFNLFYKVNGKIARINEINNVLNTKVENTPNRMMLLLDVGTDSLEKILDLFLDNKREVPALFKIKYFPKTGAFKSDIIYELQYSNVNDKSNADGFKEWIGNEEDGEVDEK